MAHVILVSAQGPNPSFFSFGGLLLNLGACLDKGLDSDLDQGLTIILTNKLPCITGFFANERCFYIYVSSVQWGIGYLQFSFMFSMHVFISPSLLHLKCYSRLLYNSFDFVCFVFIWKHLYLLHFISLWFHLLQGSPQNIPMGLVRSL